MRGTWDTLKRDATFKVNPQLQVCQMNKTYQHSFTSPSATEGIYSSHPIDRCYADGNCELPRSDCHSSLRCGFFQDLQRNRMLTNNNRAQLGRYPERSGLKRGKEYQIILTGRIIHIGACHLSARIIIINTKPMYIKYIVQSLDLHIKAGSSLSSLQPRTMYLFHSNCPCLIKEKTI